jgi:nicotinamide-nucleotide amidase
MRVEVINTGTELLLGQVTNTHVGYFGEQLLELGLRISQQIAIPDGDAIKAILEEAMIRADIVLVTGGLGPTSDDITRELTAELLDLELIEDPEITAAIRRRVERAGRRPMREINRRQAMVPHGAEVLPNDHGTAPGLYFPGGLRAGSAHVFLLPGPPRELKPMWRNSARPKIEAVLAEVGASVPVARNHFFMGMGESELAARLEPLFGDDLQRFELGYCLKAGGIIVRCIGAPAVVDGLAERIRSASPEDYVSEGGSDPAIESVVVKNLADRGEWVSTAESCTGGMIASRITDVPGSSSVFGYGFVTYANEAKSALVGVGEDLLAEHGAVSEPVVKAMAEGALGASGSDHALSVSGIAGPGGGTEEKPVGTVWIGLATKGGATITRRYHFKTDRAHFKQRTSGTALDLLRRRLGGWL